MRIGEWLQEARGDAGLSYEQAAYRLHDELPRPMWVSLSTIRRMEGLEDDDLDPIVVAALARVYGRGDDLPESVRGQVRQLKEMLIALSRCMSALSAA